MAVVEVSKTEMLHRAEFVGNDLYSILKTADNLIQNVYYNSLFDDGIFYEFVTVQYKNKQKHKVDITGLSLAGIIADISSKCEEVLLERMNNTEDTDTYKLDKDTTKKWEKCIY